MLLAEASSIFSKGLCLLTPLPQSHTRMIHPSTSCFSRDAFAPLGFERGESKKELMIRFSRSRVCGRMLQSTINLQVDFGGAGVASVWYIFQVNLEFFLSKKSDLSKIRGSNVNGYDRHLPICFCREKWSNFVWWILHLPSSLLEERSRNLSLIQFPSDSGIGPIRKNIIIEIWSNFVWRVLHLPWSLLE